MEPTVEDPDRVALGARVKLARQRAGLSQAQLAEAIGLHRSSVANAEAGTQGLSALQVAAIAKTTGQSADALLGLYSLPLPTLNVADEPVHEEEAVTPMLHVNASVQVDGRVMTTSVMVPDTHADSSVDALLDAVKALANLLGPRVEEKLLARLREPAVR